MALAPNTMNTTGSAATSGVNSAAPSITPGNITPNKEMVVTLTVGGTNVNSGNNVLIFQTLTPYKVISLLSAAVPDQQAAGVKLKSPVSAADANGLADWNRYGNLAGLRIGYMRIVTTDTTLYNYNLNYGILPAQGSTQPAWWPLSAYAKQGNGGYAKDLVIDTWPDGRPMNWPITTQTYLYFDTLPNSCTVTISFGIISEGQLVVAA